MKRASQIAFALAAVCFVLFVFGTTETGQTFLRGRIPPHATGFERDDIYMGAALAPWAYFLPAALLLATTGGLLYVRARHKNR